MSDRFLLTDQDGATGARFELEVAPPPPDLDCLLDASERCPAAEVTLTATQRAIRSWWDGDAHQARVKVQPCGNERPERIRMTLTIADARRLRDYLNKVIEK